METIIRNLLRIGLISIYPIILLLCFYLIYRKNIYRKTIEQHYKKILVNSILFVLIGVVVLFIFFKCENTIYSYDYAGHWLRSLKLRELFFENPHAILSNVYNSMNYNDYSSLPALFYLPFIIINTSYGFFAIGILVYFLLPTIILSNILYFTYFDKHPLLPLLISLVFYPLYLSIFYGEIDCIGLFFVLMAYSLIIIPDYSSIDIVDNLSINLFGFLMIFLRRWYLYTLVSIYLCYFVKLLINFKFKPTKNLFRELLKITTSGLLMFIVILLFFLPFFKNVIGNNFNEAYSFYNREGKLYNLITFYSPLILLIASFGIYKLVKFKKTEIIVYLLLSTIIPVVLFWSIQSFEYHHYYMISLNILILFTIGLYSLGNYKYLKFFLLCLLIIQPFIVFSPLDNTMPIMTNIRKKPVILDYKDEVIDFTYYLKSIITEDWQSAYLASSSSVLNDDMIRNSILPDTSAPQIDTAILDLRDGFPKDLEYVQFVIVIDPIQYSNKEYQRIFDVISNAIINEPIVSKIYQPIYSTTIADELNVTVYERVGEFTPDIKTYFYNEMISYYPDKEDFFKYILE